MHILSLIRISNRMHLSKHLHIITLKKAADNTNISGEEVYAILRKILLGKVSTSGDVARAVGRPKAVIARIIANNANR